MASKGWRKEPARHALAAKGVQTRVVGGSRRGIPISQQPKFSGAQERVMIKGVSKSRWRCPECLRALVTDMAGHYLCKIHGPVNNEGRMQYGVAGRDRPLDATILSDEEQNIIIEIGK